MSTLKVLQEYLIGDGGYLLKDDNNGKTVMLSGAWGSGKTHFWKEEIVREQSKIIVKKRKRNKYSPDEVKKGLFSILKKKKKACIYISLYGKDNIEDIKSQVFAQAYAQVPKKGNKDKNIDTAVEWLGYSSKIASAVSVLGVKIDTTQITDKAKDYQDNEKLSKAQEAIKDGGVICFDDFERKSKNIDLNDLFGVLTQLSLEFNCKVVIILNSDVFKGEEANVFKNVKEKTVNKYFHFKPTSKELFASVAEDKKYNKLNDYKEEILKVIDETDELNARIYIQVLDNCLEWVDKEYELNLIILKPFVLSSIFFAKYHYSFYIDNLESKDKIYEIYHAFNENIELAKNIRNIFPQYASGHSMTRDDIIHSLKEDVTKKKKDSNGYENAEVYYTSGDKLLEDNKYMLRDFYTYKYILKIDDEIDGELFNNINQFIKTGILAHKETNI